jgi:hypothetical protein
MDGNLRMCCHLAAWPSRRLEKMGLCYWARQPTRMALFRLLSSPVGPGPDKLLVHVFLDSGRVEFLDKAENGVKSMPIHIFLINKENYAISIRRGLAAIPSGNKPDTNDQIISRLSLVKEGDEILFYLIGRKGLRGIYRAYGRPFYDDTPIYPSNNGHVYPYRVRIDNTDMVFDTPVLLSDIFDLCDIGKIWTFSLQRPGGRANAMFSISNSEFNEIRELFLKINPILGRPAPISEPYRHFKPNLMHRLHFDNQGNPQYESGLTAIFFNGLACGQLKESLGEYSDYLAYVPTSFQKEIDGLLFYSDRKSPNKAIAYGLVELKRDVFDESGFHNYCVTKTGSSKNGPMATLEP